MGDKQTPETKPDRDVRSKRSNRTNKDTRKEAGNIEVGMVVEADEGDLGQEDISEAKVMDIVLDQEGNVESIVASKGIVFTKQLDIPVDRIQAVAPETGSDGTGGLSNKIIISASEQEIEALTSVGPESFPPEEMTSPEYGDDLLDETGKALPTDVGLRRLENEARSDSGKKGTVDGTLGTGKPGERDMGRDTPAGDDDKGNMFKVLGPGLLSGMAGNDASAVASYSLDGAQNGYGHLWLMLLSTPLLQAVQFACAKIGRVQQKGLAEILREHYGRKVAVPAALLLIIANIALIAADLVAISTGLELITGL